MIPRRLAAGLLALLLAVPGCATVAPQAEGAAAQVDPFEPMNRAVFRFNEFLDEVALEPVARAYDTFVPQLFRVPIGNVFSNVWDAWTVVNQVLQGKPREAASDAFRVAINSTLGLAGIVDLASEMGLERRREDFGQTLGRWGMGTGPYLVLPFFGPSSFRDSLGLAVDIIADPLREIGSEGRANNARLLRVVDGRASLLRAGRVVEGAALDKYTFMRDGYFQRRRNQVWDGDPPFEEDEDDQ
ncbi:MAG TPA: VacJ family lipoprotein [Quisquiliibacterium sp.]|nr:VacJ family lipoprotein [Quisquiliibacterium sp.]